MEAHIQVDPKFHRHFVIRRGEVLRQIADEYGGVAVSFPRSGTQSDKVTLKGAADCVEGAKKRILDIVEDLVSRLICQRSTQNCRNFRASAAVSSLALSNIFAFSMIDKS